MELQIREYEDWVAEDEAAAAAESKAAEEEELLLMREDEAGAPMKTWLVPEVCNMDSCIHAWYMDRIVQEMNSRLAGGDLSLLLGLPVVSERVAPRDLRVTGITYWRLNRADFLADVDLSVPLAVESDGEDSVSYFGFCMTLWFNTDEGFSFEVQDLYSAQTKPERSLWKLDEHLVPVLRRDEVEIAVQLNGKVKGKLMVPVTLTREAAQEELPRLDAVKALVGDKQIVKCIYVPGRLLNLVVK